MSDQNIVLVTADRAPWDSDSESEPLVFAFSGPDQASTFVEKTQAYIQSFEPIANIGVYNPEPVHWFSSAEGALEYLKDWLDEEDDETAVPAGD